LSQIGFMQGRLSSLVDGKIQAFPESEWQSEFALAEAIGLRKMEWTLDQDRLRSNPLVVRDGQKCIQELSSRFGVEVPSVTGDCFMQAPFWKEKGAAREQLINDFDLILNSCNVLGIQYLVIPLVDGGSIENSSQEASLLDVLKHRCETLGSLSTRVIFESDLGPQELAAFIERFEGTAEINYDVGNSSSLGFDPVEEFECYGNHILNVHVKDRIRGGTTVPLGEGDANFPLVFSLLRNMGYTGNFILQTARAQDDQHSAVLQRYKEMTLAWLKGGE
jgi:L-ribulose-5-phosphate 3-epimerase